MHQLRDYVRERYDAADEAGRMVVSVMSFGYKYGVPSEADLVFDVRFLPNPNFVPRLKRLTGARRARWCATCSASRTRPPSSARLAASSGSCSRGTRARGKSYLTIAVGCTGGRHRSVMIANALGAAVRARGFPVRVYHRDVKQG